MMKCFDQVIEMMLRKSGFGNTVRDLHCTWEGFLPKVDAISAAGAWWSVGKVMEEPLTKGEVEEGEDRGTSMEKKQQAREVLSENMNRKEKRKAVKKLRRKQIRKEMAAKAREEEDARINDPEERRRIELMEQQEAERMERERKEFEEKERAWIEAMELKKKKEAEEAAEEEQRKALEESQKQQDERENELHEDDESEYVEDGPPEIIWQGNEIIFKKKKVRVPKKDSDHKKEDANRPTSNPLPLQSEEFADYVNSSTVSAQQGLENVAQQVPNFGTEQDKAHCPFHLKTGACRFGQRCSRVHFYPDKSCTLLVKNMYNGPGLAWEQDEGLEYTDEEVEGCFEEFYEDVHTEFLKFGEIVNFKVCKNGSFHLRGNVYVQYKFLDSALLAYNSTNGRFFAGKQVRCEFVNVSRWKVAICGEYMKSGFKTCSRGTACNFIHCFWNPGGDYEWADFDKSPPKYWVKKMAALFGYSDDYEKLTKPENSNVLKNSSKVLKTDTDRYRSRRSRSTETDELNRGHSGRREHEYERKRRTLYEEEWLDKEGDRRKHKKGTRESSSKRNKDDNRSSHEADLDWENQHGVVGRSSRQRNRDNENWIYDTGSDGDWSDSDRDRDRERHHIRKSSRHRDRDYSVETSKSSKQRTRFQDDHGAYENKNEVDRDLSDSDRNRKSHHIHKGKSSRHQKKDISNVTSEDESDKALSDRDGYLETEHDSSRKSSRHRRRSSFQDDYGGYENKNEVYGDTSGRDRGRERLRIHKRKNSRHQERDKSNTISNSESDETLFDRDGHLETEHDSSGKSLRHRKRSSFLDYEGCENKNDEVDGDSSDRGRERERHHNRKRKNSRHQERYNSDAISEAESDKALFDRDGNLKTDHNSSRKSSRRRRSCSKDDYEGRESKSGEVDGDGPRKERNRRAH
ncbi:hypothetical protein L6164_036130 [Bauhinia variegata]|uniref:Uncharacterized protein n=1 Tax=Bauhinia variegata TaxID=167791 RepID=A0ACB9KG30_BAUVA|nr:hypothetical protein L6164_036130 [Bauhinia variegata]